LASRAELEDAAQHGSILPLLEEDLRTFLNVTVQWSANRDPSKAPPMTDTDTATALAHAWDLFDAASKRVLTAQPHQMTAAAEQMETARINMRSAIQATLISARKKRPVAPPIKPSSPDQLRDALTGLIAYVERNQCEHEETYRGGTNWTICSACGSKWADDEGGFQPYTPPPELTGARSALGI
jgi:hypothetical protein